MDLGQLLDPKAVDLHTAATCRVEVFRRLGRLAEEPDSEPKAADITAALQARERLGSTVVAPGVALPHARMEGLDKPRLAAVVLPEGARFDDEAVRLALAVLVPKDASQTHLDILRALATVLRQPDRLEALVNATDARSFVSALTGDDLAKP